RYCGRRRHESHLGEIHSGLAGAGVSHGNVARRRAHPFPEDRSVLKSMTWLLNNEEVEKALTPADTISATENVYRELAEGSAFNRARSQVYLPVESKANPGFRYRFKSQEGGSPGTGVWALRITSDMAGHSF